MKTSITLLCFILSILTMPLSAFAEEAGARISLRILNTRDLGYYPTTDGKIIKPHALIRSGALAKTTPEDIKTLTETYHLKTVIDFRTDTEVNNAPDPVIEKIDYMRLPLLENEIAGISHTTTFKDPIDNLISYYEAMDKNVEAYNIKSYPDLIRSPYTQGQWSKFFDIILENGEKGAILYHCTSGKDRVGTTTALLLSVLGVDRETIINDFVKTNTFVMPETKFIMELAKKKTSDPDILKNIEMLTGVRESYIHSVFDTIDKEYGSIDSYLENQLGIDSAKKAKLRAMFLIDAPA